MKIKFCGVRRAQDIEYVNEFTPDYVGFVFAKSKRQVDLEKVKFLKKNLNSKIKTVGVFVNEPLGSLIRISDILDVVQLHGDEDERYIKTVMQKLPNKEIWKAVRLKHKKDLELAQIFDVHKLLIDSFSADAYGGTGKSADWNLIREANVQKPFFLAGGLNVDNIKAAVEATNPYGVDISGGIETDGAKDRGKMKQITEIIRGVI
ncbi:MAG: Phosphoribosylanthranilate isomerase [Oscillospiraceae bacterium]|jgi:phosphoribosylanthranilate isomerase|nr:Phosphoribosylanthranilate isomerase [Oscillospiraceae bacterium]